MSAQNKSEIPEVGLKAARLAAKAKKEVSPVHKTSETTEDKDMTSKPNFEKLTSDAAASSKEHMDAFVQSGTLLTKGSEELMKTYFGLMQNSAEKSAEAVKALMACKTLNELTETQNKLAQDSFETYMTGVTKLSELTVKLANSSLEPINAQFTKSMKKASEHAAA
ncbi:MAG: phasin family domain protein [Micavibrio sp.]|nr:phasin family domain protein [Micavibrio sp.]